MCASYFRPVFAIIEVDLYSVDSSKRLAVKEEVLATLGPTDPTIVVEEEGRDARLSLQHIFDLVKPFGEIVFVRCKCFGVCCCFFCWCVCLRACMCVSMCEFHLFTECTCISWFLPAVVLSLLFLLNNSSLL